MRIAIIAPTYLPARRANTVQVMKMAQAFSAEGHEVRVAVPSQPDQGGQAIPWQELAHHYGLRLRFAVQWLPSQPRLRRFDFSYRAVQWARQQEAQLVYTRLPQAGALSSQAGLATILEVHDMPQGRVGPWLFRRFLLGRGAQRLVVITHALAQDLAARFRTPQAPPFTVIAPDGVDLERYANLPGPEAARQELMALGLPFLQGDAFDPSRFTAGYSGHLYPGRGIELLLDLAACLPTVNFLLVGGEPRDVERVNNLKDSRRLENLFLCGFVPNASLPRFQAACDILLMPYARRVAASSGGDIARYLSPMKVFEYMASGRAILSSDLPVLQEVLNPGNAVLLPSEDVDAWASALEGLREDPGRRIGLASQALQDVQGYTWEARARKVLSGLALLGSQASE